MNEFYAFQEVEQLTENLRMWQQPGGDFHGGASVIRRSSLAQVVDRWSLIADAGFDDRMDARGRRGTQAVRRRAAGEPGAPGQRDAVCDRAPAVVPPPGYVPPPARPCVGSGSARVVHARMH
jgi:hypothetical protein